MKQQYSELDPDFYDASLRSDNPVTRYYHQNRYAKIRSYLSKKFKKGMNILDIGCGSASWNTEHISITGLDINEKMLGYGKSKGYLSKTILFDLNKTPLPFEENSFDIIILSEVLEHLSSPKNLIIDVHRVLKKNGLVIITVPLDNVISLWRVLFELNCFFRGHVLNENYYKNKCGHIQHFSIKSLSKLITENGFIILDKNITMLNIGMLIQKR